MQTFDSPFLCFVFYHWIFSMFALFIFVFTWFSTHWKVFVEKW